MSQAEFLQQAGDVVGMTADNLGHLVPVPVGFFEGFAQAAAHGLAYGTVQGFLVEERITFRFQRTCQVPNQFLIGAVYDCPHFLRCLH